MGSADGRSRARSENARRRAPGRNSSARRSKPRLTLKSEPLLEEYFGSLPALFVVSAVEFGECDAVEKATGQKCERCWKYIAAEGAQVCDACRAALTKWASRNGPMNGRVRSVAIIFGVVILDRITKLYIQHNFSPWDMKPVIPGFFNIVHAENPGAAFGFLSESHSEWRSVIPGGRIARRDGDYRHDAVPPVYKEIRDARNRPGAGVRRSGWQHVGPPVPRHGHRFSAILLRQLEFPSFNAADSAITIGACLLLMDLWKNRARTAPDGRGSERG